jgi:hypothetical protein
MVKPRSPQTKIANKIAKKNRQDRSAAGARGVALSHRIVP